MTDPVSVLRAILTDYQDVIAAPDVDRGMDALREIERTLGDDSYTDARTVRISLEDRRAGSDN